MDTVDDGLPGQYKDLSGGVGNNKMDLIGVRKSPKTREEIPLKNKSPSHDSDGHPNCSQNAVYHFQSFAENASIDGIKFLGEPGRTVVEKIFWAVTLLAALVLCVILVYETFQKWTNSPVIVTFATSETPIFEIPFPAITICPDLKAKKEFFNYTDVFLKRDRNETLTAEEQIGFDYMSLICDTPSELLHNNATTDEGSILYFLSVAPDPDYFLNEFEWRGQKVQLNGTEFLSPILTSEGICYTFNALDRTDIFTNAVAFYQDFFWSHSQKSEWSLENGYAENSGIDAYPRRTFVAGAKGGLALTLHVIQQDLDYACGDSLQGFKVTLHHPAEVPRVKQNYFRIPLEHTLIASVKPNMMTTSEDLRSYSPQERKCYFVSEKSLKFFKVYNQQNCLVECLTNFTLKACGCVNFYMPRNETTPMCGASSKECAENAKVMFLASEVNYKLNQNRKSKVTRKDLKLENLNYADSCDCLPSCVSLDYEVETSQSNWDWQGAFEVIKHTSDWDHEWDDFLNNNNVHFAQMKIFFKDMQFITAERNELYGYVDFWANIGGIIGLFTGFSFITMFEILYYLTLRVSCNVRLFGRQYWSGEPELIEKARLSGNKDL